ncbi:BrnT family toxin [Methyloprofundus sp.]|uniref:BrnT family toxin n=1 Tax=Methyloprofundus sp. TaxID=2020875 RepID=UPI003D12A67C
MKKLEFEWGNDKDRVKTSKHGVSFDEAQTAFYDEYAIQFFDPEHSENEDRFLLLGTSFKLKTLVVCHCFREEETVVRIISARKADKDETKAYWSERE